MSTRRTIIASMLIILPLLANGLTAQSITKNDDGKSSDSKQQIESIGILTEQPAE